MANKTLLQVRPVGGSTWTTLPTPDYSGGYQVDRYDVDSSTSGRDQLGYMHRDRISIKRKVNCVWSNRDSADISTILTSAITGIFFELRFFDPYSAEPAGDDKCNATGTFYVGDRSMPVYTMSDSTGTIMGSFSANFIER